MVSGNFDPSMFLAIFPEIMILVLGLLILLFDLFLPKEQHDKLGWVTAGGLTLIIIGSLFVAQPSGIGEQIFGGMLRHDGLSFSFKMIFLFSAAITAMFVMGMDKVGKRGEFYLLMLASTLGMCLMSSASDLIMLYLAIETTSIPLYILAGFMTEDDKSTEAGFKYLLFGAMTSAILLYGFSLLFGFTGTTNIYKISYGLQMGSFPIVVVFGVLLLIVTGFIFKISAVPMHFWAPDVYEGAPTPVAGFLSTASKAAGFSVLLRVLLIAFPGVLPYWSAFLVAISTLTMTVGNLLALTQKNIKRMLAYSSIAHAGYALIGLGSISSLSILGISSVVFYLVAYVLTNLAAFGVVAAFGKVSGSDDIAAYAGLSRRSPVLALTMMVAFLSLAGMPPFGGFVVKFIVFSAAVQANLIWLAVVGVLNSIVGLYYYLTVLKVVYLYRSEDEEKPLPIPRSYSIALCVLVFGILAIGIVMSPWFNLSTAAAHALF
ncbi:MAG: NADH-quinone oxidoreductase subunit N [Anaerolineales bacterium]|nr:NADH-quinone oxidoreductase subunit N [Anaerolineales bacterium]